ncbi:DNA translocase FtsK [Methylophilus glucosoxydans]|uniref:DNA translocase FtsK n=1 Tax=Methylophilus glucosoxydans TaxID=752553 RepID=A0ABW3GJU5_9PROT|nr:DNA translocase FtsK 4TM domain-containing protein [Methylophilus sp. VKM B-3414]MDT7848312.1 DNA translocase FtsK 4TM domain-containing protein [Methylophilus sp. VKM B-3414]
MFFNKKKAANVRLEKVSTEKQLRDAKLIREVAWIALAALGVFLAVILLTYSHEDPGWTHAVGESDRIHNAGGTVGAWMADIFLSLFGFSSWWFVVLAFFVVWLMYQRLHQNAAEKQDWWLNAVGFALMLLASAALESGHLVSLPADFPLKQGGVIGSGIDHLLRNMFGFAGSTMLLLVLFATAFSLFTGWSLITMSERLGEWVIQFYQWSVLKYQDWQDRQVGRQVLQAREEFVEAERKRIEDRKPVEITVPEVAIAPSERVVKEKQAVLFEAIEQEGLPPLHLLDAPNQSVELQSAETLDFTSRLIERKLMDFGIEVKVVTAQPGPVITRYELDPAPGVKGSQITNLSKDLARALSVISVRVVETIPGKSYMGLEIPNPKRQIVSLTEIMGSQAYADLNSPLAIAMGKDIAGKPIVADLAKMPHVLVAGTTGSGKSVAINALILSLLYKAEASRVRMILIDPKMLELSVYEGIPHLLAPVVTDMRQAANALNWCVAEMERRYKLMSTLGVRNLAGYNQKIVDAKKQGTSIPHPFSLTPDEPEPLDEMPLIVVVIDELADLMMVVGKKVEELIARLAQKARASGIHLVLATQRPSVDVITGLIKANVPTRVAFQVSSKIDSRTILDQMGAETLLGQGDMLYLPPGSGYPQRIHGAFVSDGEVHNVVNFLKAQGEPNYIEGILTNETEGGDLDSLGGGEASAGGEKDPLYDEAVAIVLKTRRASISSVQRQLRIGYNRAARLIEDMERAGLVSAMQSNGNREVLVKAGGDHE